MKKSSPEALNIPLTASLIAAAPVVTDSLDPLTAMSAQQARSQQTLIDVNAFSNAYVGLQVL